MSDSQVIDWINENMYRAYPLRDRQAMVASTGYVLDDAVLLDAVLFADGAVQLQSLVSTDDHVDVTLSNGLVAHVGYADAFPYYYRSNDGSLLVIGDLSSVPKNATHNFTGVYFEDSVIYDLSGIWAGVPSLTFGPVYTGLPLGISSTTRLTGLIELVEGYQLSVNVPSQEVLQLSAGRLDGVPISCMNFRVTGLDNCNSVISMINGVEADSTHDLTLSGGNDVLVLNDPTNHRIFIGASFNPQDICKLPALPPFGAL